MTESTRKQPDKNPLDSATNGPQPTFIWFRHYHQLLWAVGLTGMVAVLTWHSFVTRWSGHSLIDIDKAPPRTYRYVIDLNTAEWPELTVLPGISEVYAKRIVEYRTVHGPFASVDELIGVPGIGPKRLAVIREFLTVDSTPAESDQIKTRAEIAP